MRKNMDEKLFIHLLLYITILTYLKRTDLNCTTLTVSYILFDNAVLIIYKYSKIYA
jgi:hypothetical protein